MEKNIEKPGAETGLTDAEVRRSREEHGENRLKRRKRRSFFKSFMTSFGDPMIKILLVALAVNIIFLFHRASWFESAGIAVAILLATLVSTLSEYGSESAFEKLQEEAARISCRVRRNGRLTEVPMSDIVVGDVVLLQPGDRVPADGQILEGRIETDQSALNGESKEALKYPCSARGREDDFLDPALLFSGSAVCSGEGLMLVTAVGERTVYGRIGVEIQEETRESPLHVRLGRLAATIGRFGYIAAVVTALAYFTNVILIDNLFEPVLIKYTLTSPRIMLGHILKAATLAVTVIVMAVPEGLPMMITVVLSANMRRMLKDNVLVRKLTGIETAGSLNILFTDKTGTLTRGKLEVTQFISGAGEAWRADEPIPGRLRAVLCDAVYYNSGASMDTGGAIGGNATDRAVSEYVSALGGRRTKLEKVRTVPFSSEAKYMTTTVRGEWNTTFVKGAPEKILPGCTGYFDKDGRLVHGLNTKRIEALVRKLSNDAIRLIAVAVTDSGADGGADSDGR